MPANVRWDLIWRLKDYMLISLRPRKTLQHQHSFQFFNLFRSVNPLNTELNPICSLLALLADGI